MGDFGPKKLLFFCLRKRGRKENLREYEARVFFNFPKINNNFP